MSVMTSAHVSAGRLRRAGPPGASATDWALRVALLLLVVAAGWLVYVLMRPLPIAEAAAAPRVPAIPALPDTTRPTEQRRDLLSRLSAPNLFDAEREPWSARSEAVSSDNPAAGDASDDARSNRRRGGSARTADAGGNPPGVTRADALPDDVKQALAGLMLRAVFVNSEGKPVAMISRVFSGTNPFLADPYQPGDEFEDKQFPQAKWVVEEIDVSARRVVLSRNGTTTSLELYPASAAAKPEAAKPTAAEPAALPKVVSRSANEARADLISAGLSPEEADRVLQLSAMNEGDAQTQAKLDALIKQTEGASDAAQAKKRRGPPPGMENIIKMLRESNKPSDDQPPALAPDEKPAEPATEQTKPR